ncbi:hypothetical protein [Deinococcus pimensis]|uniref:hypothetical protein n=1 Tax=Deinococcus pimensis TaxID=309888 RepID=UPI000480BFB0|nr:hypothetical protein [Deinococcus pimensis]
MIRYDRTSRRLAVVLLASLSPGALAWVPKLDETAARAVVDSAYDRRDDPVRTLLSLDLTVTDGAFAADLAPLEGSSDTTTSGDPGRTVRAFEGGDACVSNWLASPDDFATYGSRPVSVTLTGQADEAFLLAQQGRDEFRNVTARDVLAKRDGALPDGHLRVYVAMRGLESEKQRDAYTVAIRAGQGQVARPYRRGFTNDWKQDASGRWSGTMVYYFDALKAGAKPDGTLDVLLRTEADTDCAFSVTADLSKFY